MRAFSITGNEAETRIFTRGIHPHTVTGRGQVGIYAYTDKLNNGKDEVF